MVAPLNQCDRGRRRPPLRGGLRPLRSSRFTPGESVTASPERLSPEIYRGLSPRRDVGEVGGEPGVVNRGGPPPGVQARQRAEVGPSGVDADRGVGELPGGRRGDGQRPRRVGASGERGRGGRC